MTDRVFNVLFLCTGNSARPVIAESILHRDGGGRFRAFSAGSHPKGVVHPMRVHVLEDDGYPIESLCSKPWDEFARTDTPTLDFVFTVCHDAAGEVCPVWPGQPVIAHWGIKDPAAAEGTHVQRLTDFVAAFRHLKNRVTAFVALPFSSLDRMSPGARLMEIGQGGGHEPPPGRGVMDVVIYHNPACGTSRNTLALIRNAGVEPHVFEYLKCPPSHAMVVQIAERTGLGVRGLLREKGTPFDELGLGDPLLSDEQLLDAIAAHPILLNRPIVVSPKGVRLCRPSEAVLDLLPPQRGAFAKEDGERVVDATGARVG